jgi:uncharacterized YigZ family protein
MTESNQPGPDEYRVPAKKTQSEIKVKGSRFICTVIPCLSRQDAEKEYADHKKEYYDATHNCFAWKINDTEWRYSDDGEPSGTAGKPILQAIDARALKEILCIVTRYFGGTRLGTGGLIRAYGDCTAQTLDQLKTKIKTVWQGIDIEYDYALENMVRKTLSDFGGKLINSEYDQWVTMKLAIPASFVKDFCARLSELSNSQIKISNIKL